MRTEGTEVSLGMIWGKRTTGNALWPEPEATREGREIGECQEINGILFLTRKHVGVLIRNRRQRKANLEEVVKFAQGPHWVNN